MTDKKIGYGGFERSLPSVEKRCINFPNRRDGDDFSAKTIDNMQLEDLNKDLKNGECKIFVGNVPYQCTQEEFARCFQNIDGFIKAEIITVYKTNMSRGFGFVTMRSLYDAENLKQRDDILFKGRALRFTSYQNENSKPVMENLNNYVFVDGIPDGKNRDWLRNCFASYEPIGRCFVTMNHENGEMKNNGVIEIIDDSKYKCILAKRWHDIDGVTLETSRYRTKLPHMLGTIDDAALSQSHTHNTGQVNVYNNNAHASHTSHPVHERGSGDRHGGDRYVSDRHVHERQSYDRAHAHKVDYSQKRSRSDKTENYDKDSKIRVTKKRNNKNELYSAFIAGRNAGLIQGINQGIKMAKGDIQSEQSIDCQEN